MGFKGQLQCGEMNGNKLWSLRTMAGLQNPCSQPLV